MRKKEILYLDMDNTICDFNSAIIALNPELADIFNKPETEEGSVLIEEKMIKSPRLFRDLPPMPYAVNTIKRLNEHFDIYFLSTPFDGLPESFMDKKLWLNEHFGKLAYKKLILTHRKDLNVGEYLVDDRLKNGVSEFTGEHIHFATDKFPTWIEVEEYLMGQLSFLSLKTSSEWCEIIPTKYNLVILNTDGWDCKNFEFSFNEEAISLDEFKIRLSYSTIKCDILFYEFIKNMSY